MTIPKGFHPVRLVACCALTLSFVGCGVDVSTSAKGTAAALQETPPGGTTGTTTGSTTKGSTGTTTGSTTRGATGTTTGSITSGTTGTTTGSTTGGTTGTTTGSTTKGTTGSTTGLPTCPVVDPPGPCQNGNTLLYCPASANACNAYWSCSGSCGTSTTETEVKIDVTTVEEICGGANHGCGSGTPISTAVDVTVSDAESPVSPITFKTNAEGNYSLTLSVPGTYTFEIFTKNPTLGTTPSVVRVVQGEQKTASVELVETEKVP
jgi:hypothetical protein